MTTSRSVEADDAPVRHATAAETVRQPLGEDVVDKLVREAVGIADRRQSDLSGVDWSRAVVDGVGDGEARALGESVTECPLDVGEYTTFISADTSGRV